MTSTKHQKGCPAITVPPLASTAQGASRTTSPIQWGPPFQLPTGPPAPRNHLPDEHWGTAGNPGPTESEGNGRVTPTSFSCSVPVLLCGRVPGFLPPHPVPAIIAATREERKQFHNSQTGLFPPPPKKLFYPPLNSFPKVRRILESSSWGRGRAR